jgi:enoyl-CoA hydratase
VAFERDRALRVAILTGAGGTFCSGFDLKALAAGQPYGGNPADGPMGPTRMALSKPVIAAIEGYAVGGGMELALWCDLRVMARDATMGVFNRRFGVPLIDGGTVRLPRLVGQGRALDLILTGRAVGAEEALRIGLVDRVVEPGQALAAAQEMARQISAFPQAALGADRRNVFDQWSLDEEAALRKEGAGGAEVLESGEAQEGAERFAKGSGRHGT